LVSEELLLSLTSYKKMLRKRIMKIIMARVTQKKKTKEFSVNLVQTTRTVMRRLSRKALMETVTTWHHSILSKVLHRSTLLRRARRTTLMLVQSETLPMMKNSSAISNNS
jgi:hypothetical protein